jgi:uncharacterized protein (DUF433 family)
MTLTAQPEIVPLRSSDDGQMMYVGQTRVPLETVIDTFNEGATPEEIMLRFPALALADIYLVIGYYLNHRAEVEGYLERTRQHHAEVRAENERRFDVSSLREKMLARKQHRE